MSLTVGCAMVAPPTALGEPQSVATAFCNNFMQIFDETLNYILQNGGD